MVPSPECFVNELITAVIITESRKYVCGEQAVGGSVQIYKMEPCINPGSDSQPITSLFSSFVWQNQLVYSNAEQQ